jgi:hypothetical protein
MSIADYCKLSLGSSWRAPGDSSEPVRPHRPRAPGKCTPPACLSSLRPGHGAAVVRNSRRKPYTGRRTAAAAALQTRYQRHGDCPKRVGEMTRVATYRGKTTNYGSSAGVIAGFTGEYSSPHVAPIWECRCPISRHGAQARTDRRPQAGAIEDLAERARSEGWSHEEFLAACLQREVAAREAHGSEGRIRTTPFRPGRRWRTSTSTTDAR